MSLDFSDPLFLLNHLKNGNEDAFSYLIKKYHKKLLHYTISLTRDYNLAQDIVQEVYLDLWNERRKLKDTSLINNYMYKIAYHKFINNYHKNKAISALEKKYMNELERIFEDKNDKLLKEKVLLIEKGIHKLPKKCKETFILSKKEGLTNQEIAEYLNISLKTVEGHLTKAYNILRKCTGDKIKQLLFLLFKNKIKLEI
ncbi:sigma-70 family RNA polymerase sigma factor [Aestuariibaculum sp. M13]|uniref:RNA polymerase sigma factor n=1 Tax=Aestuariibaculum sp. M13 TaxID=2967132 RepID=UPI002159E27D|nr:sigma-70 family RNA polymerase sigma factor [Aestuariibaculum sp. M13]MCR8668709.1 sigma-70 family RNA polymerase sigma factor [Aestuariibaculum sp. M13]